MKEAPGAHQAERVVAGYDDVPLGGQHPLGLSQHRMWIFLELNNMHENYEVDAIR